ncbi:GntR family transcriptional regulator [Streptomyces lunaelactis]|uniref:GntR family transcriptional regulator n=1 Tax=Streptomyces lunaelactis TaxID=1535768 RepID=UPI0015858289|nr:GntR family transcriptional regulator [Streptomyces lunaelactis]NUK03343.1 GntR family transcriptional regulator [Streptomyces lunaelactis]NUK10335.1 GntR family transcriptional regulator [Streptomyces lunaelactis]NUK18150.1 GntR family transcriptional regulator [Streptomyces lunaelactis]NUK25428.1 GntR family transcriptional regulator [Streptomyces lunaelactis]NUK53121.1 GntR family transcriptional regulator [Streptomyces lunaelactis]
MPQIEETQPKYLQIAHHIRDQILRGDLRPGDEVPSERQLAADWNVSRPTAARSLEALSHQGLVEKRQGSGTYVRGLQVNRRARELYGRARQTGKIYTPGEYAVITSAGWLDAPDYVAEALNLTAGIRAVHRRRVTNNESGPITLSTSWFAAAVGERAPKLLEPDRIREGTLMYVENMTGRQGSYAEDRMCARVATDEEAADLKLPADSAVLIVHHIVFDMQDRPLEFAEATYPPGRWAFEQGYPIT